MTSLYVHSSARRRKQTAAAVSMHCAHMQKMSSRRATKRTKNSVYKDFRVSLGLSKLLSCDKVLIVDYANVFGKLQRSAVGAPCELISGHETELQNFLANKQFNIREWYFVLIFDCPLDTRVHLTELIEPAIRGAGLGPENYLIIDSCPGDASSDSTADHFAAATMLMLDSFIFASASTPKRMKYYFLSNDLDYYDDLAETWNTLDGLVNNRTEAFRANNVKQFVESLSNTGTTLRKPFLPKPGKNGEFHNELSRLHQFCRTTKLHNILIVDLSLFEDKNNCDAEDFKSYWNGIRDSTQFDHFLVIFIGRDGKLWRKTNKENAFIIVVPGSNNRLSLLTFVIDTLLHVLDQYNYQIKRSFHIVSRHPYYSRICKIWNTELDMVRFWFKQYTKLDDFDLTSFCFEDSLNNQLFPTFQLNSYTGDYVGTMMCFVDQCRAQLLWNNLSAYPEFCSVTTKFSCNIPCPDRKDQHRLTFELRSMSDESIYAALKALPGLFHNRNKRGKTIRWSIKPATTSSYDRPAVLHGDVKVTNDILYWVEEGELETLRVLFVVESTTITKDDIRTGDEIIWVKGVPRRLRRFIDHNCPAIIAGTEMYSGLFGEGQVDSSKLTSIMVKVKIPPAALPNQYIRVVAKVTKRNNFAEGLRII